MDVFLLFPAAVPSGAVVLTLWPEVEGLLLQAEAAAGQTLLLLLLPLDSDVQTKYGNEELGNCIKHSQNSCQYLLLGFCLEGSKVCVEGGLSL